MTRQEFEQRVNMAVEVEYEDGGRTWFDMKETEVDDFCRKIKERGHYLSDIDFCTKQDDDIRAILDTAKELLWGPEKRFTSLREAIDSLLDSDPEPEPEPEKRKWTEDEIRSLVQTNDKVLYGALKKLYAEQTADEQRAHETRNRNNAGFNSVDARFLSSVAEFLNKTGFLTDKQKEVARKKLVKYTRQLTRLANA